MDSQLDFLSGAEAKQLVTEKLHPAPEEERIFSYLMAHTQGKRREMNIPDDIILLKAIQNISAVCLIDENHPICHIRFRKEVHYIRFPESAVKFLPPEIVTKQIVSDNGRVRALLNTPRDALLCVDAFISALRSCADNYHTFDCCSRYVECSNAGHCIHPRPTDAVGCAYRKRLAAGQIFYGKNFTKEEIL